MCVYVYKEQGSPTDAELPLLPFYSADEATKPSRALLLMQN